MHVMYCIFSHQLYDTVDLDRFGTCTAYRIDTEEGTHHIADSRDTTRAPDLNIKALPRLKMSNLGPWFDLVPMLPIKFLHSVYSVSVLGMEF